MIESLTELPILIERSKSLGIKPYIGVRVKAKSKIKSHWSSTSGDHSVFGLSASQLIYIVDQLKAHNMLDRLQLLHCHLASQIYDISDIRNGVIEIQRYYTDLCKEGAAMGYIDFGGGLAVDYIGDHSNNNQSRNYSLKEYCETIVDTLKASCSKENIKHPVIITESGRATVFYNSIFLLNIFDVTQFKSPILPEVQEGEHDLIQKMRNIISHIKPQEIQENYHDVYFYRKKISELFKLGKIDLRTYSISETLFLGILYKIYNIMITIEPAPSELENLKKYLVDIYYGNFNLFQSLPDIWAIDQKFPIMPIHRLDEKLSKQAMLSDITCDCDGKIDHFINGHSLPLHPLKIGEDYYLGVFLLGAYQETLGNLHNLFGRTHIINIRLNKDSGFEIIEEVHGHKNADVLSYVNFQPQQMQKDFKNKVETAVNDGRINTCERQQIINAFNTLMQDYTYSTKK